MITTWILFVLTFCLGYYLGGKGKVITEEVKEKLESIIKDKPRPGVVRQLTPEEIEDKHDPKKQGNLEAFNKLMTDLGVKKPA